MVLDTDSREWLRRLSADAADHADRREHEEALQQLHRLLLRAAFAELRRRAARLNITGPEVDDLAHQAADDALVAITAKLGQFRGESRFTTWAYKFVILEVSSKVGRHFLTQPRIDLTDDAWDRIPDRFGVDPAEHAVSADLVAALREAVQQSLSERQRSVFVALIVQGVPLDALAIELGSTRNALYKTMFDARRKIRAYLVAHGYLQDEGLLTS